MRFSLFSVMDHYPGEVSRTETQFVNEFLEQTALADDLGYECAWVAEHHFSSYGMISNPAVLLAAAAARTRRIRLGPAVVVLPLRSPVNAAEDYALVDHISGGRLNLAVGSGYLAHEFEPLGIPIEEKVDRFNEALDLFKAFWTQPSTTFSGKYYSLSGAGNAVPPLQKPTPPMWIAVLRKEAAYWVGRKGYNMMGIAYVTVNQPGELREMIDSFKKGYAESGASPEHPEICIGLKVHVAETREQAIAEARESVERYLRTRKYAKGGTFDSLMANRLLAVGDPDDVAGVIEEYRAAGATQIMCLQNFGGLPHELVMRSIRLMAEHVMPRFRSPAVV